MTITAAHIPAIVAMIAGILILLMPRLLNLVVAIYLICVGLIGTTRLSSRGIKRIRMPAIRATMAGMWAEVMVIENSPLGGLSNRGGTYPVARFHDSRRRSPRSGSAGPGA